MLPPALALAAGAKQLSPLPLNRLSEREIREAGHFLSDASLRS